MRAIIALFSVSAVLAGGPVLAAEEPAPTATNLDLTREVPPEPPGLFHSTILMPRPAMPDRPEPGTGPIRSTPPERPTAAAPQPMPEAPETPRPMPMPEALQQAVRPSAPQAPKSPYGSPLDPPYWAKETAKSLPMLRSPQPIETAPEPLAPQPEPMAPQPTARPSPYGQAPGYAARPAWGGGWARPGYGTGYGYGYAPRRAYPYGYAPGYAPRNPYYPTQGWGYNPGSATQSAQPAE